jgi:hypothetical protein
MKEILAPTETRNRPTFRVRELEVLNGGERIYFPDGYRDDNANRNLFKLAILPN